MKRVLLALLLLAASSESDGAQWGIRLEGTFIQYQPWMTNLHERAWRQELDAMRRAEIKTEQVQRQHQP